MTKTPEDQTPNILDGVRIRSFQLKKTYRRHTSTEANKTPENV